MPVYRYNESRERREKMRDADKSVDLNEDPDYESNAEHERNGEGRGVERITAHADVESVERMRRELER
jgi:hypothetical protein